MTPQLHADLAPLAFLLGTWRGRGEGHYPTIDSFGYFEEITFGHVGKPFIAYTQKTRHADTDLPLHAEAGYFRPAGPTTFEFIVVQPSGIVEVHDGSIEGQHLTLDTTSVLTTPTAKSVTQVRRVIEVDGDTLTYDLSMAAVGEPFQHHLHATLIRADPAAA
ncbi:MAG: FABP family protein [Actinomycetota bacterium]|nr:FABP family protein [Actinomycetota bacterium]